MEIQRNPQIQPTTKIIPIEFTKEETTTFLRRCKEWQTTVQGAVQTAASVAMVDMMDEREFEVEATVTVNSRPFFKTNVPTEYVGPYFCRLSCRNKILSSPNPEQFWKIAKVTSEDIHARLKLKNTWKLRKCLLSCDQHLLRCQERSKVIEVVGVAYLCWSSQTLATANFLMELQMMTSSLEQCTAAPQNTNKDPPSLATTWPHSTENVFGRLCIIATL